MFKGQAPGAGSGEMSRRTEALRPAILLTPPEIQQARQLRRSGLDPARIAAAMGKPLDEVEKALVQMRMPRPETTRGTLNVTLAAHRVVMQERRGDEPIWQTVDRLIDELLRMRAEAAAGGKGNGSRPVTGHRARSADANALPLLPGLVD